MLFRSPNQMCINRSNVGSASVVLCRSPTIPSDSRNQRSLRLTTMIGRRPVTWSYSPKCPATGCSEAAWKRLNKCRGRSKEESVEKLKHHLHASKLHYMGKAEAEEMAESYDGWEYHDSDEEDVPPGLDPPSVNSGAPLSLVRSRSLTPAGRGPITLRRSRSAPKTPSPPRGGRRRKHSTRLAIADSELSSRTDNDRQQETMYRRVFISVESSIRAARRAQ